MKLRFKNLALSAVLLGVASTAQALTISASTSVYAQGDWPTVAADSDTDHSGGGVGASSAKWGSSWSGRSYATAGAAANADEGGVAARGMGVGYFSYARVGWVENYVNSSAVAEALYLDFLVGGGELELYDRYGRARGQSSSYWIDILVDGSSIWSSSVELSRDTSGAVSMTETGASLGGLFSSGSTWATYRWASSSLTTLSLGVLAPGEGLTLSFLMGTHAGGQGSCLGGGSSYGCMSSMSSDASFTLAGAPTLYATPLASVPEPGTLLLLGGGVLALGAVAARRRRMV